jgi:alkaline phosphatase
VAAAALPRVLDEALRRILRRAPVQAPDKTYVANEQYKTVAGAVSRPGILPRTASTGVHTGEDVILTAMGPGAQHVSGFMENTEVFRVIARSLGVGND